MYDKAEHVGDGNNVGLVVSPKDIESLQPIFLQKFTSLSISPFGNKHFRENTEVKFDILSSRDLDKSPV